MNSRNKTGSINAFDFDLGLGSGGAKPMNNLKNQAPSYSSTVQQKPNTTSSWTQQPNKPAWTHQPVGSLSGPTSMVGDISGKSWNSSPSSSSSLSDIGIVNSKNPNLFGDLLGSSMSNKSSSHVPLKNVGKNAFSMGSVADSLPKTGNSTNSSGIWGSNISNSGGNTNFGANYSKGPGLGSGNVNLGVNSNRNTNLGGPSMKNMCGNGVGVGVGVGGTGLNKDPFESLVDFSSKPQSGIKPASKESNRSGLGYDAFGEFQNAPSKPSISTFETKTIDPINDFGFTNTQNQPSVKPSGANDFDVLFPFLDSGTRDNEGITSQQFSGGDDWGIGLEIGGGDDGAGTTELEGLPPPPAGVTAPSAKNKGMDNYKQGQFADAIKWLSWAVILLEKAGDDNGTMEVLTSRASCYKEVGEYKKAVADCTKVLEHDGKNVSVLVQRALLYESMEKYKLGAEDLRTVMKLDPGNRVAISTIHRLAKMAEQ